MRWQNNELNFIGDLKIMKMLVDSEKCTASGKCILVCPLSAITLIGGIANINHDLCDFDGLCIPACPHGAISFEEDS